VGSSRARHVDVRVVTATNVNVAEAVAAGRFREDLFYRLNTVEIELPPLRDRREDIPELAVLFLARQVARYGKPITGFDSGAMHALLDHRWPGNVRELEHVVERAVLMAPGALVTAEDLNLRSRADSATRFEDMTLEQAEKALIERALRRGDSVTDAAKRLGLSRSALYRRIDYFGLKVGD
jgi:transcriptional regulator with PAS, ATPase and Fis domain